jgi:methionine synthase I (cobalamin-dependent)
MAKDPSRRRYCAGALGPTNKTASISNRVNDPGFRNICMYYLLLPHFIACTNNNL